MDYTPNRLIRLVQFGLTRELLHCSTIWICVGCNTCSSQCPMAIDIPRLMDTIRQIALERGVAVPQPDILAFHQEVLRSIKRYGRTHKLEIMFRYKIKQRNWFEDLDVGLRMLAKRKLDLTPSRIKEIDSFQPLLEKSAMERNHG
jgi:heterodisulfide reductase subunit C